MPTLLRGSVLVDIGSAVARRGYAVHPLETWVSMGFQMRGDGVGPYPMSVLQALRLSDLRHLIGNGMHVNAIGTWLQFILASVQVPVDK